jgi:hypothetical protein
VTVVGSPVGRAGSEHPPHEAAPPSVAALVTRLRDAADRMVAFSVTKTLLRDAATTIEQLEGRLAAQRH